MNDFAVLQGRPSRVTRPRHRHQAGLRRQRSLTRCAWSANPEAGQIKLPPSLKPWLQAQSRQSQSGRVIDFRGAPVASIRTAWRTVQAKLEMDDQVQPYGIRHTMVRWLRKSSVPAWVVAAQLGYKSPDVSTTEIYVPFDPAYLFKRPQQSTTSCSALRVSCVFVRSPSS